jgi:MFS family permease
LLFPSIRCSRSSTAIFLDNKPSYGHIIAAACFIIQAVGIGTYVTYGVFFNSLMAEFQWPRAIISGASSLAFFLMGLFGMLIGRLNDRYGPQQLMRVTALFFGAGFMLMSQVDTLWQLYLYYGVLFGIGLSAIDVIALTTVARWFSSRRGLMTGIVKVGTGAGQFSIPLVASLLIAVHGWRQAYLMIGAVAMVVLLGIAQLLKRDPSKLKPLPSSGGVSPAVQKAIDSRSLSAGQATRTIQLWTICSVNLALVFCLLIILVHIVPHARDTGLSAAQAAGVLSTIGGVSMAGRFLSGMAIDRIGSKSIMVTCFFVLIAGLLWLQAARSLWMLYVFACIYGLAHGDFSLQYPPWQPKFSVWAHTAPLSASLSASAPQAGRSALSSPGSYSM